MVTMQVDDMRARIADSDTWFPAGDTRSDRLERMGVFDLLDGIVDEDDLVVEIGCSLGDTTGELEERYDARVIGIDLFDHFARDGEYLQCGASALPLADGSVDVYVAPNSLGRLSEHGLADDAYIEEVLDELERAGSGDTGLVLADGYRGCAALHARNDDGWNVEALRSMDGPWRARDAEQYYRDWIGAMDDEPYREQPRHVKGGA